MHHPILFSISIAQEPPLKCLPAAMQVVRGEGLIYMVLEYGDIDLARLLDRRQRARAQLGCKELDGNFIRLYWQQMLQVQPPRTYVYCSPFWSPQQAV